jgi:hypothetical protein
MRQKIIRLFLFFSPALPSFLSAFLVGNPASPSLLEEGVVFKESCVNLRVGYHASFIGDERLRVYKDEEEKFTSLRIPARMQIFSLTLNIKERADLCLYSGSDLLFPRIQMGNTVYELKSGSSFFVAGGGRMILVENNDFSFGLDGKYLFFKTHIASLYKNRQPLASVHSYLELKEWQVTPAISYKSGFLIPYFGIPCRFAKMQINHLSFVESSVLRLRSMHKAGLCLGISISPCTQAFLNLEGVWLDENVFTISSEVRF